jgi:cytochrome P450
VTAFVPPYPHRPDKPLPVLEIIRRANRSFLDIWSDAAFGQQLISTRLMMRKVFVCNAPELVQYAFSSHNGAFERKSPQMRHALAPLLGDGLFISDGETWRRRRKIVGPVIHTSRVPDLAPVMVETVLEARERWAQLGEGASVDALSDMAQLTAEIICRTIFGRELGRDHAREVVEGFSAYQRVVGQIDVISLLGLPDWIPRYRSRRCGARPSASTTCSTASSTTCRSGATATAAPSLAACSTPATRRRASRSAAKRCATRPPSSSWPGTRRPPTR